MKNRTKGLIAGVAGIALLAGGSTFALWTAETELAGGTITNGDLNVGTIGGLTWRDVSDPTAPQAIADIATWRMVPGDTIEATQALDVALVGDNLSAELALGGLEPSDLPVGVTVTYDVIAADDAGIAADVPLDQAADLTFTSSDDTATAGGIGVGSTLDGTTADVTVVVRVAFDADARVSTGSVSTLADLSATLTQKSRA